ncbi:MAG: hypothetical protein Greene041614_24 [Parcubacteria group bacterium Greene0416_14]|nr:MAG: hypothetical protein Greene041614_24 [Parcubacteria group bacterium Greene0416_14]TSD01772.1 MAG: hypothetical protein Greene101415_30 [Parcubacteria group bacterium Greene1014_15]TSD08486.1 MAG: hypothetical protein Greene07144_25 [Parcubacteria group bacterium Greene0714_4]
MEERRDVLRESFSQNFVENSSHDMSYTKKYIEGELVIASWGFVSKGIGFINTVITLSALSVYQYGVFQLLLSGYGFFSGLTGIGVSFAGTDVSCAMGDGNEARAKRIFLQTHGVRLLFSLLAAGIFYFGTPLVSFKYDDTFLAFFKIFSFLFVSDELIAFGKKLMAYRLDFGTFARRSSIQKIIQCGILLYFLFFGSIGIREVLLSIVISSYASVLFLLPGTVRAYKPWRLVTAERGPVFWRLLRAHGKWFLAGQFLGLFTDRIQPWLIKIFISTEAVAIYSIADTMVGIIRKLFPTSTLSSIIPLRVHDRVMARRILTYGTKYFVALMFVVGCLSFVLAPPVIRTFFVPYEGALPYFYALLITLPMNALVIIPALYVHALRKQKFWFFHDMFKTILRIPSLLILLPLLGLWGMVFDKLFMMTIMLLIFLVYLSRMKHDIPIAWNRFFVFDHEDAQFLKLLKDQIRSVLDRKFAHFLNKREMT